MVSSLAGRVRDPVVPVGEVRIGGFGGAEGLREWLQHQHIDVVVDATHPFAATMTANAAAATRVLGLPLIRLSRPGWQPVSGDQWIRVSSPAAAADTVAGLGERVLLTIGRQEVSAFAGCTESWFLIRAIDPPDPPLPPRHELLLARGPFDLASETALLSRERIDVLVTKDSGGALTSAKLTAAREAGVAVIVIDRPVPPPGVPITMDVTETMDRLRSFSECRCCAPDPGHDT